jgi:hypothetical protein
MQTAFGPIVAGYLVVQRRHWLCPKHRRQSQVPAGELVDSVRAKRLLVWAGVVAVALSVLIL